MANTVQARKRARQAEVRRALNASQRSTVRTHVKNTLQAIAGGDKSKAVEIMKKALPIIDRSARKGLISKNTAARKKAQISRRLKALG